MDRWQVWVCRVPTSTEVATYGQGPKGTARVPLDPVELAGWFSSHVAPWFETVSHGAQVFVFRPGGVVTLNDAEGPEACLERSLDASAAAVGSPGEQGLIHGVLAVADAVHVTSDRGGFGRAGGNCTSTVCPAVVTRRGAYVGGADFLPDWGELPLFDLVEHELGHALGWGHSGISPSGAYLSAIDLMSDSASLRTVDPDQRHGPPPLAVHRAAAGWIPAGDVAELHQGLVSPQQVVLHSAGSSDGVRLLRLDADVGERGDGQWLGVELLDDPLLAGLATGIAVHRVGDNSIIPLVGEPPFTDLLGPGDQWSGDGWALEIIGPLTEEPGAAWQLTISR